WTILASCLATYFMICVYGRFTLVTGETALHACRKHIHPAMGIFFIVSLTAAVSGSVIGVMGIISDICHEWSKTVLDGGIAPIWFAIFFISLVYYIFWHGNTRAFERAMSVIVAIMGVCFFANFFILMPPPIDIVKGLIPNIPNVNTDTGNSSFLVIASMVGTTVFPGLFIIRTLLVKDAGWTIKDAKQQRNDAAFSVFLMFALSGAIMASAAGTLFVQGTGLSKASEMITLLEPLAGKLATAIFAMGIIAAGVSSQLPNVLMLPWLLCDYNNSPRDMTKTHYRIMVFCISLLGLIVPIFKAPPVFVMIVSQAFNSIILPVTVACILYLGNRKDLMGEYKNSLATNILLVAILIFSLITSSMGIGSVWKLITGA
ncbi:MAG: divalent metal cation transporter, partial [Kiritimatiellaceae bacterium]|nr:divalent metal cation transporter [Kiritimatiellaceae bacterium]